MLGSNNPIPVGGTCGLWLTVVELKVIEGLNAAICTGFTQCEVIHHIAKHGLTILSHRFTIKIFLLNYPAVYLRGVTSPPPFVA